VSRAPDAAGERLARNPLPRATRRRNHLLRLNGTALVADPYM